MRQKILKMLVLTTATLTLSTASQAVCTRNQAAGIWETFFSDGNSCKLKLNGKGEVVAEASLCYDPGRGLTIPESGSFTVTDNCSAVGELVVEGVTIELGGQFSTTLNTAAGVFLLGNGAKGSFSMIRLP